MVAASGGAPVWVVGAALVVGSVLAEFLGGSNFHGFFEFGYGRNPKLGWRDDRPVKILLARIGLLLGLALLVLGLVSR